VDPDLINTVISNAVVVLMVVLPGLLRLATKIERLSSSLAHKFDALEKQVSQVQEELRSARAARAQIWKELNTLRERTKGVESELEHTRRS